MNKARGGDGISVEQFQILKDDAVKVLHSTCQQIQKSQQWPQDWKRSDSFQSQRKAMIMFNLPHKCAYFTYQQGNAQNPSSQASAVCELRTSRCSNWIQRRQRNQRSNCQHLLDHRKSKRIPEKKKNSSSLIMLKNLTVWIKPNCGEFLKR